MGPLLFLLHINDLPQSVTSSVRLFADDCLLYRTIRSTEDSVCLQRDLDALEAWGARWGMRFNVGKCNILRITRSRSPITRWYTLGGQILQEVDQAKYLGITITSELGWSAHINSTCNKAKSTLGFLKRNLKRAPKGLKELSYFSLVRSKLEYAASIWDPYHTKDINNLEMVQRRAARFVNNDYNWGSSVTSMLQELGWQDLASRRKDIRLALFYKVVNQLVAVPAEDILDKANPRFRSKHPMTYRHIKTNCDTYKHSFFPRTIIEWNNLSSSTVEAPSIDSFKHRLRPTAQPARCADGLAPSHCQ